MYRLFVPVTIAALLALNLTACSGRVYIGMERTDTVQEVRTMTNQPWYCAYVTCDKGGK